MKHEIRRLFIEIIICLLFSICWVTQVKAKQAIAPQYSYGYSKKPIKINARQYEKYIRPQLSSLTESFYSLVEKAHPTQKEVLIWRKEILSKMKSTKLLLSKCFNRSFDCNQNDWTQIYEHLLSINKLALSFKPQFELYTIENEIFVDKFLKFLPEFRLSIHKYIQKFESYHVENWYHDELSNNFVQLSVFAETNLSLIMTGIMEERDRDLFYSLWQNFIKFIESKILDNRDLNALKANLERLNILWNNFHYQIERDHITVGPEKKRVLRNMHTRWTRVLKIIVG